MNIKSFGVAVILIATIALSGEAYAVPTTTGVATISGTVSSAFDIKNIDPTPAFQTGPVFGDTDDANEVTTPQDTFDIKANGGWMLSVKENVETPDNKMSYTGTGGGIASNALLVHYPDTSGGINLGTSTDPIEHGEATTGWSPRHVKYGQIFTWNDKAGDYTISLAWSISPPAPASH